jgi:hypothetical protein
LELGFVEVESPASTFFLEHSGRLGERRLRNYRQDAQDLQSLQTSAVEIQLPIALSHETLSVIKNDLKPILD